MYNKNDPLVNSVKAIMEQNDLRRRVEAKLCEELGIYSRKQLPREHVANYDALLEQRVKEELVGNQHKIDANKNNRVDAHDFKLLRAKKEAMKEEDKSSSDPDFAAPADPRAPKYKDEIKYKEEPKATMPKNPPMPPRRPPNLEETSHMKKLDELSLDKMNAAKKEAEKRKGMAEKGTSPVDKKYAERYGKYVELAKRRMKSKMDEEALEEKATPAQQKKVEKVMGEFKKGELHSGSKKGPEVTSRKQAVAIALSQAGLSKKKVDEDFDLEAVMEELRANLGEERVDEIVDWFRNRMAGTKPQSPTAAQSMAANPPPTRQSGREGGEQIASALSRSAERGYGDTGAARRASGASLASQPEPGYTGSAARRVSGAALASQPEPGRSSAAQPERQNMTSITAGIANRVNSRPSTTQTASSPAATAPAPSPAATAPAPSPAATAPASRPAAPAARPTPSPAARPAAPAPEPRSRQMFQAAQDREDRGEAGGSAAFFAADKQRTAELRGMQESKSLTSTINKVLKG